MIIKQYLTEPLILTSLGAGDTLYLYLAVSEVLISAALFKEDENKNLRSIFFIRKSLLELEIRYTRLKQVALALRVATKKFHPYFKAHPIVVLTNLSLQNTIHKPDLSGRMARWAIDRSEFGIQYEPCLALKGQVLADFLEELPQLDVVQDNNGWWILNVDGASRQKGAGVGLQLKALTRERVVQAIRLEFPASNNETEYEAILAGIDLAQSVSSEKLLIRSDSQLVVGQVNGEYEMQDQRMTRYMGLVKQQLGSFVTWKFEHIPRDSNEKANALEAVGTSVLIKETVFLPIYYQLTLSIATDRVSQIYKIDPSWLTSILHCLSSEEIPNNRAKAHKVQVQAT